MRIFTRSAAAPKSGPLFLHASGHYCLKRKGRFFYFGRDADVALQKYLDGTFLDYRRMGKELLKVLGKTTVVEELRPNDFAMLAGAPKTMIDACPFYDPDEERVWLDDEIGFVLWDAFPVSDGHALVIPRRHVRYLSTRMRT